MHSFKGSVVLPDIMPSPPIVDFGDFLSGDPERKKKCTEAIGQACRTLGILSDHQQSDP